MPETSGAYASYANELRAVRSGFAGMFHIIDFYILNSASGAAEYLTLKNEIEIRDLWKFIIKHYMQ